MTAKKEALDLIYRQKAEIERLSACVKSEDEIRAIMKAQMAPMVKEITDEQIDLANKLGRIDGILKFAERLKEKYKNYVVISMDKINNGINNLVKEMVGES